MAEFDVWSEGSINRRKNVRVNKSIKKRRSCVHINIVHSNKTAEFVVKRVVVCSEIK